MQNNIMWKQKNLNFGQLSLNFTHCSAPQTDFEPSYSEPDSALEPLGSSSAARHTTAIPETWQQDTTNTLSLTSLGRN